MRPRGLMVFGIILIAFGLIALISTVTGFDFWQVCFPVGLILLGVWVLWRPRMVRGDTEIHFQLIGDVKRTGSWTFKKEEIWSFIGDIDIDLNQVQVVPGENKLHAYNFIGDVDIIVPSDIGLSLIADGFLNSIKWMGTKQDNFFTTAHLTTPGYDQAERKVQIEVTSFIGDIKVNPAANY
jgi:lia operon protein LiaF